MMVSLVLRRLIESLEEAEILEGGEK